MANNTRAKFGYLSYNDMLSKIRSGIFDAYDFIYTKDTHEGYIVAEDLQPISIKSRVYSFNSVNEANDALNTNKDTYNGQIVAILDGDIFRGYIVNAKNDKYTVTPLYEHPEPIDYNTLGNRPIVNLVGTLDEPIIVSNLDDGVYRIKGQHKVSDLEETVYLSASDIIFTVKKDEDSIKVKRITSDDIIDYVITSSVISKNIYVTDKYLEDNNYPTASYVDKKIEALYISIKEDLKSYVQNIVDELFATELDNRIDARIDEKINPMDKSQINNLF